MKHAAILFLLLAACSTSDDPNVDTTNQAINQDHGCPDPAPTTTDTTYTTSPFYDNTTQCPPNNPLYPARCAVCSVEPNSKTCVPTCNSSSNKCNMWQSGSTNEVRCRQPTDRTIHICESIPSI